MKECDCCGERDFLKPYGCQELCNDCHRVAIDPNITYRRINLDSIEKCNGSDFNEI